MTCLKREIREETGQKKFKIIAKTRHYMKYKFPKGYVKDHHIYHGAKGYVYVVEAFGKKVKVDRKEHDKHMWVSKKEALEIITHKNHKNALKYVCKRYKLT
jgi:8-oxo-dGTP pyrophosphatase MutT (NUDIX family)